jgi:hypothetical protein
VLVWKQLQQGSFRWPPIMDGVMAAATDARRGRHYSVSLIASRRPDR